MAAIPSAAYFVTASSLLLLCFTETEVLGRKGASTWLKNRSLDFTISSKKNESGHWVTKCLINHSSPRLPNRWKVDFKHSVTSNEEMEMFRIDAILTAPPPQPDDYTLFPGIGYYKMHDGKPQNYDAAQATCAREGGHLGIINSDAESIVYKSLLNRRNIHAAFIGFHDRVNEGEFVTIFGDPLNATGFHKWNKGQPDNSHGKEDCGCIREEGTLCDIGCEEVKPYICEYDLSWAY